MLSREILDGLKGKAALITGGTGLIGRAVVKLLQEAGCRVGIVSLDYVETGEIPLIRANLTDFTVCRQVIRDFDFVFHLAGIKGSAKVSTTMPASHFVPSLQMNTNVLEAARIAGVKKLVFTSSIGAYASADIFRESDFRLDSIPMDLAGWAKRMAELQIQAYRTQYGLDWSIVRPANVYGPGDNFDPENAMVIPSLMARIAAGENPLVVWGDGSAIRDYAYSGDIAEGIIRALFKPGTYNLGSGLGISTMELVNTLRSVIDFKYEFDASKPSGYPTRIMDISLAREKIGYEPHTSLAEGLKETWSWFLKHKDEHKSKQNYFK